MKQKVIHVHYHNKTNKLLYSLLCFMTAMVGYQLHHSVFYSIINFIFMPISWAYWLITDQITIALLKQTFPILFN